MPAQKTQVARLRRFTGVDVSHDSAFLRPDQLVRATNWVPDRTWLLRKRFGSLAYLSDTSATSAAQALIRVYRSNGDRLFYMVAPFAGGDQVRLSTNDGAFGAVTTGTFTSTGSLYGRCQLRQNVYFGNGVDDVKRIDFDTDPATAVNLSQLASFTDDSTINVVAITAGSNKDLATGIYAFAWGVYDSVTKLWTKRSAARLITVATDARVFEVTIAPSAALGTNERYHLFIAPVGLPIEFAHDHFADGVVAGDFPGGDRRINEILTSTTPIPTPNGVIRKGRFLVSHRSRLWLAGDQSSRRRVSATNVILPGTEQAVFDQGEFFPVNATFRLDDEITGLGVAAVGEITESPTSPLAIFTRASTYLLFGDILDDPSAELIVASERIGCISHHTIVPTPLGLIFCGNESVYLLRPDGSRPIDIGMAINRAIREIPEAARVKACATYHKGFYKLAVTPVGGQDNTIQWWLDLRDGVDTISWWGPHNIVAYNAMTIATRDSAEVDRGFASLQVTGDAEIMLIDQDNAFVDTGGTTVKSILQTPALDFQQPFQRKIFTRLRVNGRAPAMETLSVVATTDEGISVSADPLVIEGTTGGVWGTAIWDVDAWGSVFFDEAESIFPADRPRGVSVQIELTHNAARKIELRDVDLHYLPVERAVQ